MKNWNWIRDCNLIIVKFWLRKKYDLIVNLVLYVWSGISNYVNILICFYIFIVSFNIFFKYKV